MKLTGRQKDALKILLGYDFRGTRQARLAAEGVSRSLLVNLWAKGLAERLETPIGTAWFISSDGRAALESQQ